MTYWSFAAATRMIPTRSALRQLRGPTTVSSVGPVVAHAGGPVHAELELSEPREHLLREELQTLRRLAVRHEARAARQHEVLERPDPLAMLEDLPVDAVRAAREHQALGHRLLRGDADQAGGRPRGGGHPGPRLRRVERGRERGRDGPGQELRVLRRGAERGVEEPEQLAADAHAFLVGVPV